MDRLELFLHPVRMRIVLAVANRVLTTQQVVELLSDVPQTTIYRHINLLLEGEILTVVREIKIRGTVERELALVENAARLDMEASAAIPLEQQEQLFTMFIAALLSDFKRAVSQPIAGVPAAFYQRQRLAMSVDTLQTLNEQIEALLEPYEVPESVEPNDQQWLFTGIIMADAVVPLAEKE